MSFPRDIITEEALTYLSLKIVKCLGKLLKNKIVYIMLLIGFKVLLDLRSTLELMIQEVWSGLRLCISK